MRAEIIAIGDELTSGQRLDTNSQWLSERLGEIGIPVAFHTTVGDDLENNIAVFRAAIDRAELVIASGGLGPAAALAHIRGLFARRKREMPERNKLQAQFPRGSRVVPNPDGTAPGIDLTVPRSSGPPCRVIALPGVPAEMFAMWNETVAPALVAGQSEKQVIRHYRIKCFGVGESDLEAMLPDMIRRKREPLVGITVSGATITLRITASGPNEAACRKSMEPTVAQIREILGVLVYGAEDDELEHAVVRLLNERGRSVSVAEWATDGLVSQWLAEAASGGSCLRSGIVVRDTAALKSLLKIEVPADATATAETASAMARVIQQITAAEYGLGIAAFPIGGPEVPTAAAGHSIDMSGTLHVALATGDNVRVKSFPIATHPSITKTRSAKQALNMLRLALLNSAE
jgi:nicotinamide-nucleotide amidase